MLVFSDGKIHYDIQCRAENKEEIRQLFFSAVEEKKSGNKGGNCFA